MRHGGPWLILTDTKSYRLSLQGQICLESSNTLGKCDLVIYMSLSPRLYLYINPPGDTALLHWTISCLYIAPPDQLTKIPACHTSYINLPKPNFVRLVNGHTSNEMVQYITYTYQISAFPDVTYRPSIYKRELFSVVPSEWF